MLRPELQQRIGEFCRRQQMTPRDWLGFGVHGIVMSADYQSNTGSIAIKAHEHEADYRRERDVYWRLDAYDVMDIRGCAVPKLLAWDDELWILAMTIVERPFVLDFAGAFLDRAPDFSEEVMADWYAEKKEQFGAYWSEAQAIMRFLENLGIFLVDVTPNNISLRP